MLPSITIVILTHARTALLNRALYSALMQDYAGDWFVLIVNDCPEQTIHFDASARVAIVNAPYLGSVGAKRNFAVDRVATEWVAWLDDDDVLLQGHLEKIKFALSRGKECLASAQTLWFCEETGKGEITSPALADYLATRLILKEYRFEEISCGEDERLWKKIRESNRSTPDRGRPTYAQVWCNGSFHVTGAGWTPNAHHRFRQNALERIRRKQEPTGLISLRLDAGMDYESLASPIIQAWAVTANPEPLPLFKGTT